MTTSSTATSRVRTAPFASFRALRRSRQHPQSHARYRAEGPGLVSPFFSLAFGVAIATRHPWFGALLCVGGLLVLLSRMGLFPLPAALTSPVGSLSQTLHAEGGAVEPHPHGHPSWRVWGFVGAASGVLLVLLVLLVS